jgi:hypothetical protein
LHAQNICSNPIHRSTEAAKSPVNKGIHIRRDDLVSVMYTTELNSTISLALPQRIDRHGILDQKPPDFQLLSG